MKKILFGVILGAVYGMLFTKESGRDLRKKLKKSKNPVKDFIKAGINMDMDFVKYLQKEYEKYCKK